MAEGAKATNAPIDPRKLSGWVQTSIYIARNVNTPFSIESHRAILFKVDPKLVNMALTEISKEANSLLFGKSFFKT